MLCIDPSETLASKVGVSSLLSSTTAFCSLAVLYSMLLSRLSLRVQGQVILAHKYCQVWSRLLSRLFSDLVSLCVFHQKRFELWRYVFLWEVTLGPEKVFLYDPHVDDVIEQLLISWDSRIEPVLLDSDRRRHKSQLSHTHTRTGLGVLRHLSLALTAPQPRRFFSVLF